MVFICTKIDPIGVMLMDLHFKAFRLEALPWNLFKWLDTIRNVEIAWQLFYASDLLD